MMKQFNVIRDHIGDREYKTGDVREANEAEVKHLIGTCLAPIGAACEASKDAGAAPENKAMKGAAKTKAGEADQPAEPVAE